MNMQYQDFKELDIQKFNIELNKNYVISASAGTGKTYTIVEMIKKLLDKGVTLDKILVVTYTEKAAGELKDRIRTAITKSKGISRIGANDVDTASIGTIHSFCQNIIDEYFISAGKPSCQKLIDENKCKDFIKRYIRQGEIFNDICSFNTWQSKKHIRNPKTITEKDLIDTLFGTIEKYYLDRNGNPDTSIISIDDKQELEDLYNCDAVKYVRMHNTIQGYAQNELAQNELQALQSSNVDKYKNLYLTLQNSDDMYFDGNIKPTKADSIDLKNAFEKIKQIKLVLNDDKNISYKKDFSKIITCRYIDKLYLDWQKEKENLAEQTFNDMIRNVREEVVNDGPLLQRILDKYSYAIIDEFQDTNQKQWDIFGKAFLNGDDHHLIVVGDPKQSIYSFQGADVTAYEKAVEEIKNAGGECYSLNHNYRATKELIESTNAFFDKEQNKDALPANMAFSYSKVGNSNFKAEYDGKPIKAFWIPEKEVSADNYAAIVCNKIVDFCSEVNGKTRLQIWDKDGKQRSVSFKDFTILARTHSELKPFQNAFNRCGIPYTQYKDTNLFSGKECADWIAILEAISVPEFTGNHRAYFRSALFTSFFGYSFDSVYSPDFDKDSGPEFEMFAKWREYAAKREWAKMIESVIVETEVAGKLQSLDKIKIFGAIMQISEYCIDYLSRTNNLEMLIRNLKDNFSNQNNNENDEDDENANLIAQSTDIDCVQMMTIHASKGLEFPIVISAAGYKGLPKNAIKVYTYHNLKNETLLSFDKNKDEFKEEFLRLLYVAYTRAKYLLILPYPLKTSNASELLKKTVTSIQNYANAHKGEYEPLPDSSLCKSFEDLKPDVQKICSQTNKALTIKQQDIENRVQQLKDFGSKVYFHVSHKHAYSSLSHGSNEKADEHENTVPADGAIIENDTLKHDQIEETESLGLSIFDQSGIQIDCEYSQIDSIELSPNFISGAAVGKALHRVFELIDYSKENQNIDDLIENSFAEERIRCKKEWIADVNNIVQNVLAAKLPAIHGGKKEMNSFSLNEITFENRKNEVEFNYCIDMQNHLSHYMNGFVDLIFKRGSYYSILDWKSDRLDDDRFTCYHDKKVLKERVDEIYSIQRVLYSYCLIKWLKQFYSEKTEEEIFEEHFGGIYYVFLRGCNAGTGNGIYAQTWENFDSLAKEYEKILKEKVH